MSKTKSRKKPVWIYIPDGFEPLEILPTSLHQHADSARYMLHRIIWGKAMKRANESGYVNLKTDYLRDVIPKRALKRLKDRLIKRKVIDCDFQFVKGKKSFGYRLSEDYFQRAIVRYQLSDKKVSDKIRKIRRADYKKIRLDVHRYLRRQFRHLKIDLARALENLSQLYSFEVVKIPALQIADKEHRFSVCRYGRVHTNLTNCHSSIR